MQTVKFGRRRAAQCPDRSIFTPGRLYRNNIPGAQYRKATRVTRGAFVPPIGK